MKVHTLTLFILLFTALLVTPAFASDSQSYIHISGHHTLESPIGDVGDVHYSFTLSGGTQIGKPSTYFELDGKISLTYIPLTWQYAEGLVVHKIKFDHVEVKVYLNGPTPLNHTFSSLYTGDLSEDANYANFSVAMQQIFYKQYSSFKSGLYYWSVEVTGVYKEDKQVLTGFTVLSQYSDMFIASYSTSNNWEGNVTTGLNIAFSMITSIWSNVGSKISNLDWGAIANLRVEDFVGAIITMFGTIGYGIEETVTMPLTALSVMTSYSTDVVTTSVFILAIFISALVLIAFLWVLWKVIMLVKP